MAWNSLKKYWQSYKAFRDLVVIFIITIVAFILALEFDLFEKMSNWYLNQKRLEQWQIDEIFIALIVFLLSSVVFAWRRWRELRKEMAERRQAEKALRSISANLRAVIQASPLAITVLDHEGKVTLWNPAAEHIFGWQAEEVLSRPLPIIPADKQEEFRGLRERALRGESISGVELRRQKKDGSFVDISLSTAPIYDLTDDDKAALLGTMAVLADITEQKRAKEVIRESEEKFRVIFDNARDGILMANIETKKFFMGNKRICQMLGYTEEEIKNLGVVDIHPAKDLPYVIEQFEKQVRGEISFVGDIPLQRKDGSVFYADINASLVSLIGVAYILGIFRDVSDRRRVQEVLRESENKYRSLVENIEERNFIYTHNTAGVFTYLSPSVTKILGYTQEEFLTHYTRYLTDNPVNREVIRYTELSIQGIRQPPYEVEIYHQDGTSRWLEVSETPVFDQEGKVTVVQGIARNITERKQAEEALRNSEERFRAVAQSANDAIISADRKGNIISWNQGAQNIFGYEEEEIVGRPLTLLMPGRYRETHEQEMERLYATGEARVIGKILEMEGLRKDGSEFPLELSLATWRAGGDIYYSGVIRDTTERRRAEEELRKSEEKYRAMIEHSHDLIWTLDQKGNFTFVNERAEEVSGYKMEELLGKSFAPLIPPPDLPRIQEIFFETLESKTKYYEVEVLRKDGSTFILEVNVTAIIEENKTVGTLNFGRDITKRKKAEEALAESEERLRFVLEGSQQGIWDWNLETGEVKRNERWAEMLGYTLPEIKFSVNQGRELIHPDDRVAVWQLIQDHLEGRLPVYEVEYRMRTKDGRYKWILDRARIVKRDSRGRPLRMSGTHTDITEHKRLEEQLRQSQKMEAVGTLAGGIAHDFNNLLTAIIINLHIAKTKIKTGQPLEQNLAEIENISRRAVQLIRQLLAFSRRQLIQPVPLNLNNIIANISEMLSRLLHEHIELDLQLAGNLGNIKADPSQMEQIILNLGINARDAMPKGGKLILKTGNVTLDENYIVQRPWAKKGDYVQLEVTDTGTGMDEVTLARIFEPFFTTKEAGEGTGLGLAMVYGIVKQHQGYIDVYSQPDWGTTFKIYLPRSEEKLEAEIVQRTTSIVGGKETILLAEDEEPLLEAVQQILEMYGYTVLTTRNGQEAVEVYGREKERIDLVILDAVMPRLGGKEAADWIYKINPRQKILFSSGYSAEGLHESFVIPRTMHFIQKPYNTEILAQKVREVLES